MNSNILSSLRFPPKSGNSGKAERWKMYGVPWLQLVSCALWFFRGTNFKAWFKGILQDVISLKYEVEVCKDDFCYAEILRTMRER